VFRADETLTDFMFEIDGAIEEDQQARPPADNIEEIDPPLGGIRGLYR
jgi:hypothetical protein